MFVFQWPAAKLKGDSQTMPRVCPGCLKHTTTEWRYGYRAPLPLWLFTRTTYYQTFYYCEDCTQPLRSYFRLQTLLGWLYLPIVIGWVGLFAGGIVLFSKGGPLGAIGEKLGEGPVIGGSAAVAFAVFYVLGWFLKSIFRSKAGKDAVWGPSAYYVGDGLMGFGSLNTRIYRALSPEWLRALVQANPDQVDDATYQRIVGTPKPETRDVRPFAAA